MKGNLVERVENLEKEIVLLKEVLPSIVTWIQIQDEQIEELKNTLKAIAELIEEIVGKAVIIKDEEETENP